MKRNWKIIGEERAAKLGDQAMRERRGGPPEQSLERETQGGERERGALTRCMQERKWRRRGMCGGLKRKAAERTPLTERCMDPKHWKFTRTNIVELGSDEVLNDIRLI